MKGSVFNIQPCSIHDGPGIRTTVFLKGCPLHCLWCQNPESQCEQPQLLYYPNLCVGCGACVGVCRSGAVRTNGNKVRTDRRVCDGCGHCAGVCPARARELAGRLAEASEVAEDACADKLFFDQSSGGVTLSGGEVLAQPAFAAEVLSICRKNGVHTAIETSGHASPERLDAVLAHTDLVLYDFKQMDEVAHRRLTGVGNRQILENARKVAREWDIPLVARIPLIPGMTDLAENIRMTAQFVHREIGSDTRVHLLPYNPLGESKNRSLEQDNPVEARRQDDSRLEALLDIVLSQGLNGVIGG